MGSHDPSTRERLRAVALFFATLASVYLVYGYQWMGGDPLHDPEIAGGSARFAVALMSILLAHEMGHYLVARRHGFHLSLPYFIPFPFAFGTLGAIIRLRSLPPHRSALLEMGAAGPLAGLVVSLVALAAGLPGTVEHLGPQVVLPWPEPASAVVSAPGVLDAALAVIDGWLVAASRLPLLEQLLAPPPQRALPMMILANPPAMDLLGWAINGVAPGRFATLDPLAMAGWVGCLLTAINLLPIGQLDGGHVFNASFPAKARGVARAGLVLLLLGGLVWAGWAVWAVLLYSLQAWRSLPVPPTPGLSPRARAVGLVAVAAFGVAFMPRPLQVDSLPLDDIEFTWPDGSPATLTDAQRALGLSGSASESSEQ